MKTCMLAFSLIAILGFTGIADAKGQGHGGIRGKIETVTAGTDTASGSFTVTMHMHMHARKGATGTSTAGTATPTTAPTTFTVEFTSSTTVMVNGVAGKIDSSMVGKHVRVIGTRNGTTITATQIIVSDGHHKKTAA